MADLEQRPALELVDVVGEAHRLARRIGVRLVEHEAQHLVAVEQPVRDEDHAVPRGLARAGDPQAARDRWTAAFAGRQRPVLAVHVEHDHVRVGQPGRPLQHQRDRPALARAGASENCEVALEQLVPVGDRGGSLLGDEAPQQQALVRRDVVAEDRHEADEQLVLDHMAVAADVGERVCTAYEPVRAAAVALDQCPDQAQPHDAGGRLLDPRLAGRARRDGGDERDEMLARSAPAGGDEIVDGHA
ncbi:MAG: hypothetical protein QOI42_1905 [Frankiaceae bacterium]|nr:hypothetical protein [Frankiaceae bacterium]